MASSTSLLLAKLLHFGSMDFVVNTAGLLSLSTTFIKDLTFHFGCLAIADKGDFIFMT